MFYLFFQSDELIGSEEAIGARNATLEMEEKFSPRIRMSGTTIRPKEAILVILALALLVFSIMLFYKHWSKNYRELNTLPYYAYLYKVRLQLDTHISWVPTKVCFSSSLVTCKAFQSSEQIETNSKKARFRIC